MNENNLNNPTEYVYDLNYDLFLCGCCEAYPCKIDQKQPIKPEAQQVVVQNLLNKVYAASYADSEKHVLKEINSPNPTIAQACLVTCIIIVLQCLSIENE